MAGDGMAHDGDEDHGSAPLRQKSSEKKDFSHVTENK